MKTFSLLIHSPDEGVYYEGEVESVTFPMADGGGCTILADHQEEVGLVVSGYGKIVTPEGVKEYCTNGGIAYVTPHKTELALLHVDDKEHYQAMLERIADPKAKARRKQSYMEHQTGAIALAKAINQGSKGKRHLDED